MAVTCPRCGRSTGRVERHCPHCGLPALLEWVAVPPAGAAEPPPVPRRPPYTGPPRYAVQQRGGLPLGPWQRDPGPVDPDPVQLARSAAGTAVPLLHACAAVALAAAVAEGWRYSLLLASRSDALDATTVSVSDALVLSAGAVGVVGTLLAGLLVVLWSVRAAAAAAAVAGVRPARRTREIVLGWLVPVVNLAVPGAVLAEIEHAALERPGGERPRPSRLLVVWWVLWVVSVLLAAFVALWSLRTGVQALADGVLLHAVLDVLAAATAVVTARVVTHLTRLLVPARTDRREVLVRLAPPVSAQPG